jgi:hypothetical protein
MKARLAALSPLIIGIFLGAVSALLGQTPPAIALWSGMHVLGNHVGYLLGALAAAYLNARSFWKSFAAAAATIFIASAVYYALIYLLGALHWARYTESVGDMFAGLAFWTALGAVCGAPAAAAMRLIRRGGLKIIRISAAAAVWLGMAAVIFLFQIVPILNQYHNPQAAERGYISGMFGGHNLAGDIFGVCLALALTMVLFVFLIRAKEESE